MKNIRFFLIAGFSILSIGAAGIYLAHDEPTASESVASLQKKLAESERLVAELRARESTPSAFGLTRDDRSSASALGADVRPDGTQDPGSEAKLEEIAARLEQRVNLLEKHLKDAQLIPTTREEKNALIVQERQNLVVMQGELEAQNAEAARLARVWNIPEGIAKLDPWEKESDPIHQQYHAYFEAKKKAGYLQKYAIERQNRILALELSCS